MTRKPAWRYKCDFCGKTGYSAGHMRKHEKHCTANDNRECRVCKLMEGEQKPMADLVAAAWSGIDALEKAADECPACMLAAIRRMPPMHEPGYSRYGQGEEDDLSKWNFKQAMKDVLDAFNERTQCY